MCQQEQKGRKRYAKRGHTDRCKDKRNGCAVQERFINARILLFRTSHWKVSALCLSLSTLFSEHTQSFAMKTIVLPLLVFNLHNGFSQSDLANIYPLDLRSPKQLVDLTWS